MSTVRWNKILRDLWKNKTKTILVVLAIAVGLFAFGSVFITQDVLGLGMNTDFQNTNPANIIISMSGFDDELVRWAKRQPGITDAQGRAQYTVKLIGRDGKDFNLTLLAYDDYGNITVNEISPQAGAFPPGRNEILLERASVGLAGNIGETLTVEMSNGRRYDLKITGTVYDIAVPPAFMFPMPYGYISKRTLEYLDFPTSYNQLNIVAGPESQQIPTLEKIADTMRAELRDRNFNVYSVQVQLSNKHWAKEIFDSFTLILGGVGVFSLVLSAFLVINTVTALLAQQRRQIGVMKAIGGTGSQITGLYLILVGFYGLLALLVALPVSLVLAYAFSAQITGMLNLDLTNFYLPTRVLLLEFGAALVVPLIAAFFPVLNGVRINVRETLSNYGIAKAANGLLDRVLIRVKGLPRPVLLSLRNTFRRKGRLLMTLGTLTLAGTLFISVMNIRDSLITDEAYLFKQYFDWDVMLSLEGNYKASGLEERALRVPGVKAAEARSGVSVQLVKEDGSRGRSFSVSGLEVASSFTKMDVNSGRWLKEGDENSLVISTAMMQYLPGVDIGDTVTLWTGSKKRDWKIIGTFPNPWDLIGYADFDYVSRIRGTDGLANEVYIVSDGRSVFNQEEFAKTVEESLKDSDIKVATSMTSDTIASSWAGRDAFVINFLLSMAALAGIIGGLGLMGLMSLNVMERTREIGIMRSIGASNRSVGSVVLTEGLLIGVISWVASLPISIPISLVFNRPMGELMVGKPLTFIFSPSGIILWLGLVVVISVVASLVPAYRAMKMSIRETLAYE